MRTVVRSPRASLCENSGEMAELLCVSGEMAESFCL